MEEYWKTVHFYDKIVKIVGNFVENVTLSVINVNLYRNYWKYLYKSYYFR
jgi:hypothetical protein